MHAPPRPRGSRIALITLSAGLWGASLAEACLARTRVELGLDIVTAAAAGTATILAGITIAAQWAAQARRERTEEMLIKTVASVIRRDGGPPTGPQKLRAL